MAFADASRALPLSRTGTQPSLWLSLVWLVLTAAVLTFVEIVWTHGSSPDQTFAVTISALGGLVTIVLGAVAWGLRPSNRTGSLLYLLGIATLVSAGGGVGDRVVATLCDVLTQTPIPVLAHLVLAFPSGRLRGRLETWFVTVAYLLFIALGLLNWILDERDAAGALDRLYLVQNAIGVVLVVSLTLMLAARPRAEGSRQRRTLALVQAGGLATMVFLILSAFVLRQVHPVSPLTLFLVQSIVFLAVPFYFAAGMLTGIFGRTGEIEELGAWLGRTQPVAPHVRDQLAATLGDPSLELLFRRSGSEAMMTPDGAPGTLPDPGSARSHVPVTGPDGVMGAIVYDITVVGERTLVDAAARVVALAVDRERLTVDLRASQDALRRSRARLVDAGDQQRRQFAQDLHDLLQSRLLLAAMHAGSLAAAPSTPADHEGVLALRAELDGAITELRRLVHGVMPALLVERGLVAAVEDLVGRLPLPTRAVLDDEGLPLPPAVASNGYFIIAEALANAVRHARASRLTVRVQRAGDVLCIEIGDDGVGGVSPTGAGVRGMSDRVGALDGTMHVESRRGEGTTIRVELPCAS